ncbi:MAG TPA: STAS domain-containing protein [Planctomycetota bacterium]|jgi:anti-anti-sigma factor
MPLFAGLTTESVLRDGALVIDLTGSLDSALDLDASAFAIEQTSADHAIAVLTGLDYISSAGFSALIRLSEAAAAAKKTLYIVGVPLRIHLVFSALGAHNVLHILPTLEDAMQKIRSGQPCAN